MNKIIDYIVVSGSNPKPNKLRKEVCNYLEQGWQPYGYPYLDRNGTEKQAMVKYEESPPKKPKGKANND